MTHGFCDIPPGEAMNKMQDSDIPILISHAVLRKEFFGGLLFNYLLPPELKLDKIRFKIALMCNGSFALRDIKDRMEHELSHSRQYTDYLVESTLGQFDVLALLCWRREELDMPRDFGLSSNPEAPGPRLLSAPLAAIWEITQKCNLRCKHCFSSSGRQQPDELSTEEAKRAIDILADRKVLYINFTGGEPLLRPDMFEILGHASSKKMAINLSTNGTLVTSKVAELLRETNVQSVQISIDGLGELHNRFRGMSGAFEEALRAIRLLKDAGMDVEISTSVNRTNLGQIPQIIDLAADTGALVFKTTLFIPVGRGRSNQGELALEKRDVRWLARLIKEKREELKGRLFLENCSSYPWLLDENCPAPPSWMRARNIGCSAGSTNIFISSNGDVAPCPFLSDMRLGNICMDDFSKIWGSSRLDVFRNLTPGDLKGRCKDCEHLGMRCYGGCRAAALAYNGDLFGEDPFCWKGVAGS